MSETYNIPSVTVEEVVGQLTDLYCQAYMAGELKSAPSAVLWGSMGVGKSTAAAEIADRMSREIQKEVVVTEIRLLNFTPVDLMGIPVADAEMRALERIPLKERMACIAVLAKYVKLLKEEIHGTES